MLAVHHARLASAGLIARCSLARSWKSSWSRRARRRVAREAGRELLGGEHGAPDRLLGPLRVAREGVALDRGLARQQKTTASIDSASTVTAR